MSGNRQTSATIVEPLRAVLQAAREVAAAENCTRWDELDAAVIDLVRWCRSVPLDVETGGRL